MNHCCHDDGKCIDCEDWRTKTLMQPQVGQKFTITGLPEIEWEVRDIFPLEPIREESESSLRAIAPSKNDPSEGNCIYLSQENWKYLNWITVTTKLTKEQAEKVKRIFEEQIVGYPNYEIAVNQAIDAMTE